MTDPNTFDIQIASVHGIEDNIFMAAGELATAVGTNLGWRNKDALGGPNDIVYLLAGLDFWKDVVPFAGKAVAAGVLGGVGKTLWDRLLRAGVALGGDIEPSPRQTEIVERLSQLMSRIAETPRYWGVESEVRFALPTTVGTPRLDVGFVLHEAEFDPALAIMALNIIGPEVMSVVDEVRRAHGVSDLGHRPQVTGQIAVLDDGTVTAAMSANGKKIDLKA